MKILTIFALLFSFSAAAKKIKLNRYIAIKTCYEDGDCVGPAAKHLEKSRIELEMMPYSKGKDRGITASDVQIVQDGKTLFKSEIRVLKKEKTDFYYVYMMIKSGTSRHGKVKVSKIKDIKNFDQKITLDRPIKTKDGFLQAQLVLGPDIAISQ